MELLARAANQEKETKGTQIGKEEIQPTFNQSAYSVQRIPKKSTEKVLE